MQYGPRRTRLACHGNRRDSTDDLPSRLGDAKQEQIEDQELPDLEGEQIQ